MPSRRSSSRNRAACVMSRSFLQLKSIRREAVEQAVAAGAAQIRLAAATIGAARRVRGIPRLGGLRVAQTLPVDMADHRRALRAARPIAAGAVPPPRAG